MTQIKAPERVTLTQNDFLVFLAGSIEMGRAEPWQDEVASRLLAANPSIKVANPRRLDWNKDAVQSIDDPYFNEQVNWELDHLDRANLVLFYFQPSTMSPITLLELGRHLSTSRRPDNTIVCCPQGFWRRGNVEVVMQRAGLGRPLETLDSMIEAAILKVRGIHDVV